MIGHTAYRFVVVWSCLIGQLFGFSPASRADVEIAKHHRVKNRACCCVWACISTMGAHLGSTRYSGPGGLVRRQVHRPGNDFGRRSGLHESLGRALHHEGASISRMGQEEGDSWIVVLRIGPGKHSTGEVGERVWYFDPNHPEDDPSVDWEWFAWAWDKWAVTLD